MDKKRLWFDLLGSGGTSGFPLWSATGNQWTQYWEQLQALDVTQTESVTELGTFSATSNLYRSACLAPNGTDIYAISYSANNVLKINTLDDTTSTFGTLAGTRMSACLAPNGKIISAPLNATTILEIDPSTDTVRTIAGSYGTGTQKWIGGTVADNGLCYFAPYDSPNILEYNPLTDAIRLIDISGTSPGSAKFRGAQLAPNGKIYFIPYAAGAVGVFDPSDDSYSTIAVAAGSAQYERAALFGNYIYSMPVSSSRVLRIDWTDDTLTETIVHASFANKYAGTTLAANKTIYSSVWNYNQVGKLPIATETISLIGTVTLFGQKWTSGILAKNGSIYQPPFDAATFLKVLSSDQDLPLNFVLSRYNNKS